MVLDGIGGYSLVLDGIELFWMELDGIGWYWMMLAPQRVTSTPPAPLLLPAPAQLFIPIQYDKHKPEKRNENEAKWREVAESATAAVGTSARNQHATCSSLPEPAYLFKSDGIGWYWRVFVGIGWYWMVLVGIG